jgi:phytoene synthase
LDELIASPTNVTASEEDFAYCRAEVKRFDPDRYFSSLFAGEKGSLALQSLYAFNLEIAKTRESVSEPMLGQIRLQWWREALDGIYAGTPRNHAVVMALAHTIEAHDLDRIRFDRLIDGREFDLEDRQPHTLDELISYAAKTSGELTCLALECLGARGEEIEAVGRRTGIAWALTGLLLAIPFHVSQNRCFLPRDLTDAHGVPITALLAGRPPDTLTAVAAEIAEKASDQLVPLAEKSRIVTRIMMPALSHLAIARANLRRLEKTGHDVFAVRPISPLGRQWRTVAATRLRLI